VRHLLSVADLDRGALEALMDLADRLAADPSLGAGALADATVALVFPDDAVATRLSFERAVERLGARLVSSPGADRSGQSLRRTIETVAAHGVDVVVIRHRSSGVPSQVTRWTNAAVVSAGDGSHQHPTQAVVDALVVRSRLGALDGRRVAVVGDVSASVESRSAVQAFSLLGAEVVLVAPTTLLPASLAGWPVTVSHDLDAVVPTVDAIVVLPLDDDRVAGRLVPSVREFTDRYGLTERRTAMLQDGAVVLPAGDVGVGVAVRSAVLLTVLGRHVASGPDTRGAG